MPNPHTPCLNFQNGSCACFRPDWSEQGYPIFEREPRCELYPHAVYDGESEDESERAFLTADDASMDEEVCAFCCHPAEEPVVEPRYGKTVCRACQNDF